MTSFDPQSSGPARPYSGFRAPSAFPPVILGLLIINAGVFFLEALLRLPLLEWFALWPLGTPDVVMTPMGPVALDGFRPWQLLSYGFLHGSLLHLFVNMFALWMFGTALEHRWGSGRFLFYYLFCVVGAGLIQLIVATHAARTGLPYPTVGASGGVFGILLGFGMLFPNQRIMLLIPPIPLKAKYFVIGYGAFTLWAGMTGTMAGVAHFAHLGGMLFGFLLIQYWRSGLGYGGFRR
ncbi:MAG: rhomboid family intramembrane serine protease [Ectothiorhodospiraceae bacterium]|nr:rhomboid family intramembrane serine protease [Ectothiorhodospiraceae bacterium]MCH8504777.1 rhomboid family intramembrane serine protease [Ectothiorhodospiraceae bacterium]